MAKYNEYKIESFPQDTAAMIDDVFAFHKTVHIAIAKIGKSYYHPIFDDPQFLDMDTLYSVKAHTVKPLPTIKTNIDFNQYMKPYKAFP